MRWSWRRGCPVDAGRLRLLTVDCWGFDRRVHRGELVVHRDHARRILGVMEKLFNAHYPIRPGGPGPTGPGPGAAMIRPGDKVVRAFAAAGWRWGGYWTGSRDYQHFSATGR
jgi:hypothetical protein